MGFLSNIIGATVKVALTPIAIVNDTVKVANGEQPTNTANLLDSAIDDVKEAGSDLLDGDL